MNTYRRTTNLIAVLVVASWMATDARAQEAEQEADELVTRIYRVFDLVMPAPQYPFDGLRLPGVSDARRAASSTGGGYGGGMMGGGMMGGMGGGGSMGGGGFFDVGDGVGVMWQVDGEGTGGGGLGGFGSGMVEYGGSSFRAGQASPFRFTADDLIDAITTTVEPDSWEDVGGEGSLTMLGGKLIIRQRLPIHQQIDELLMALRSEGGTMTSVVVEAYWLLMDQSTKDGLISEGNLVKPARLSQLASQAYGHGQVTCLDGQTVHLLAGNVRGLVTSLVPVVGESKPEPGDRAVVARPEPTAVNPHVLAQVSSGTEGESLPYRRQSSVGYQPVTQVVNFGAVLQVTPAVVPQLDSVLLDLQSIVIRPTGEDSSGVQFESVMRLNQLNLVAQQFMTTVRMPLNQPVLVGGSTWSPSSSGPATDAGGRLYLIVKATTMK